MRWAAVCVCVSEREKKIGGESEDGCGGGTLPSL